MWRWMLRRSPRTRHAFTLRMRSRCLIWGGVEEKKQNLGVVAAYLPVRTLALAYRYLSMAGFTIHPGLCRNNAGYACFGSINRLAVNQI